MDQFAKETLPISIEEEMRRSYLDYAMSVIVGRALPDVRERILADGSEPVGSKPEVFRKYLLADAAKWKNLIKPE